MSDEEPKQKLDGRALVIAKRMGYIKDEPKKEEIPPVPPPPSSKPTSPQEASDLYRRYLELSLERPPPSPPQVNASGRVRSDSIARGDFSPSIPADFLSYARVFKYPESSRNARSTLETVYERLLAFPNIGYASIQRITRAVVDSIILGEEKYDQAFGGFIPASNQFGITDLRAKHYENEVLEDSQLIMLYGWWDKESRPDVFIRMRAGSSYLPNFYMTPYSQGYCLLPVPIIIEPRSSLRVDRETNNSKTKLPLADTQLIGYYFAPCYRLIDRGST